MKHENVRKSTKNKIGKSGRMAKAFRVRDLVIIPKIFVTISALSLMVIVTVFFFFSYIGRPIQ